MRPLFSLTFSIIVLLILSACGDSSSGDTPPADNIAPVANAGNDLNAQVGQTITITGSGTDSDGVIVSYEQKKGSTILANTASFSYTFIS